MSKSSLREATEVHYTTLNAPLDSDTLPISTQLVTQPDADKEDKEGLKE